MDAIIVPTARTADAVLPAIELAAELGCTLVVLCSGRSSAGAVARLGNERNIELVAIDLSNFHHRVLPRLQTSELLSNTRFEVRADTSVKRNLGLLLSRIVGWQRVVFLDDDIVVPEPVDLRRAAGLTDAYAGVGLSLDGYPDNSVVCHAYREAGGAQDTFIGAGALVVGPRSMTSFFPAIYNEDWLFLVGDDGELQPTTSIGTALQRPYDPFADLRRARMEELGDCIAEGLFWLFDNGLSVHDADRRFWLRSLRRRFDFITDVVCMVQRRCDDPVRRTSMLTSLRAARSRCRTITPELCVRYLAAWQADRAVWRNHVSTLQQIHGMPVGDPSDGPIAGPEKVIASLGLAHASRVVPCSR